MTQRVEFAPRKLGGLGPLGSIDLGLVRPGDRASQRFQHMVAMTGRTIGGGALRPVAIRTSLAAGLGLGDGGGRGPLVREINVGAADAVQHRAVAFKAAGLHVPGVIESPA